jgi:hypothetical protein
MKMGMSPPGVMYRTLASVMRSANGIIADDGALIATPFFRRRAIGNPTRKCGCAATSESGVVPALRKKQGY